MRCLADPNFHEMKSNEKSFSRYICPNRNESYAIKSIGSISREFIAVFLYLKCFEKQPEQKDESHTATPPILTQTQWQHSQGNGKLKLVTNSEPETI
jgi:hypothetical protein